MNTGKAPGLDGIPNEVLELLIVYYPELLLSTFNICLQEGKFHNDWKMQKLVLLRKGDKPLNRVSSYRPLCLLDTMGKLLESLILQRLKTHSKGKNGMSDRQYGFRKGRSAINAVQELVNRAETAKNFFYELTSFEVYFLFVSS